MNKTTLVLVLLLVATALATPMATDSFFVPGPVPMAENDNQTIKYCVEFTTENMTFPAMGMNVAIQATCKDNNDLFGCQPEDLPVAPEFSITLLQNVTGEDGCVDVELITTEAFGVYYFSLNGLVEEMSVTEETSSAYVPEFGILGAITALGVAGLFIAKRRAD